MDEKLINRGKTTLIQAHWCKIMILVILLLGSISPVFAMEWDNVKSYDQETKTATITNALGLGDTIAELKLETPLNVYVIPGKDRKVAEFTISNYQKDYDDAFKRIKLYNKEDMRRTNDRTFTYKYATYSSKEVDVYENVCDKNNKCQDIYQGKRIDTRTTWNTFTSLSELPEGDVRVGIFTDVYEDDYIEWIPTFFGVEIDEWATWSDSLTVDLERYWKFDENTSTTAVDSVNGDDLTVIGTHWSAGKINAGYNVTGENSPTTFNADTSKNLTINMWIKKLATNDWEGGFHILLSNQPDNTAAGAGRISWLTQNNPVMRMNLNDDGGSNNFEWTQAVGTWNMTTIRLNHTAVSFFVDGVVQDVEAITNFDGLNVPLEFFSDTGGTNPISETTIDEVGIWSRALSESEISDLWNSGAGLEYPTNPSVTLNAPADEFETISNDLTFNCTAEDSTNTTNVTLYLEGVANYTELAGTGTTAELYYTITDIGSGTYNWTCSARDNDNLIGWASSNRSFTIAEIAFSGANYSSSVVEGSSNSFSINVNHTSSNWNLITNNLYYNNTFYPTTKSGTGDDVTFTSSIEAPNVETTTNKSFYWRVGLTNATGTYYHNSSWYNQTISIINMSLCDNPYTVHFMNMTLYNEQTLVEMNGTVSLTFSYKETTASDAFENSFTYSNTTGTKSHYDFCIDPADKTYSIDSVLEYTAPGYVNKFFNFNDVDFTNDTTVFGLYLLNESDSTSFIISVKDASYQAKAEVDVYVQRFDAGSDTWFTSEIATTDSSGNAIAHIYTEDAVYRFKIYEDGVLIYTTTSGVISCPSTPCTVTIIIGDTFEGGLSPYILSDIDATMEYNKVSQTITYTYEDTNTSFTQGRLYVVRMAPGEVDIEPVCNTTSALSTAVLTCDLSSETNGTYISTGFITRDYEFVVLRNAYDKIRDIVGVIGYDGVLWSIFLLIGIVMVGIYRPSLGIIFGVIGVIMMWLLQLVSISYTALVAVVGIGIILLLEVRKQ